MNTVEEYVKHPYYCALCERIYQWSADDLAWLYQQTPNMPCGHPWLYRRDMEDDPRVFQVITSRIDDPSSGDIIQYVLSDLRVGYPLIYEIVKRFPKITQLSITSEPTHIEVSVLSLEHATISQSPSDEHYKQ